MTFARFVRLMIVFAVAFLASLPARAQEKKPAAPPMSKEQQAQMDAMMKAMAPGPAHKQLAQLVGDWTFTSKMWMDPSAPPTDMSGTTSYRMILGGRYLHGEHHGSFMGMPFEGLGDVAFDNLTQKYYASWMDNMGTSLLVLPGSYDAAKKAYTFTGEMPDPAKPSVVIKVREVITLVDADTHRLEWYQTQGGKEARTMEIVYTRKK